MKREDGKYVVKKLMRDTNTNLEGVGDTMEDARRALKEEVKKYREGLRMGLSHIIGVASTVRSPGMKLVRQSNGLYSSVMDHERRSPVFMRRSLIDQIESQNKNDTDGQK